MFMTQANVVESVVIGLSVAVAGIAGVVRLERRASIAPQTKIPPEVHRE